MAFPVNITLDACRCRQPEALAELVRRHQRQLRAYVAAICADLGAVDDLAQEVFLRAFQAIDRLADVEIFGAFLRGIARNTVKEHYRRDFCLRSVMWNLSMRRWKSAVEATRVLPGSTMAA